MRGQNLVRKQEVRADDALQVAETFFTIQGEGPFAGECATFIRLTGCNLRCWFCDTIWDDNENLYYSPMEIAEQVVGITPPHCNLIVITGGEPLRQNIEPLIYALWNFRDDLHIQIETAGTYWQDILEESHITIVVSPKTPKIHPQIYENADAFKYVIQAGQTDQDDGLPVMSTQKQGEQARLARPRPGAPVYLSPCDEGANNPEQTTANHRAVADLAMRYGYRAGIQLHKIFNLR